MNLKAIRV